jgi:hypothetical protein
MRLPLLAAAVALAASAVPAEAMYLPVCGTHLAAAAAGTVSSCSSGNNPVTPATRTLSVTVVTGTVEASIQCFSPSWSPVATATFSEGQRGSVSVPEYGSSCSARLTAKTDGATATGVSSFSPRPITATP